MGSKVLFEGSFCFTGTDGAMDFEEELVDFLDVAGREVRC